MIPLPAEKIPKFSLANPRPKGDIPMLSTPKTEQIVISAPVSEKASILGGAAGAAAAMAASVGVAGRLLLCPCSSWFLIPL